MGAERSWWAEPFRTFQTNLREIDAGLDVDSVLDHLADLGANTWLLNTAGIVSFYPSQLDFQYPSPWLSERSSGDLIADAVTGAHDRGTRVVSRVDLSKVHPHIADRYPDWCFVGVDGEPQIYNGLYSMCPSGPYYQRRAPEILAEILENYPVDGFFFNWFGFNVYDYSRRYHGICQCEHCQRRFLEQTGLPLPTQEDWSDPTYHQWLDYTRSTLADLAGRFRAFIKQRAPHAALMLHYDPDVVFYEANNAVDRPQPLWLYATGEFVRQSRASAPKKPVWVNSVLFIDMPYRFVPEQPGMLGLYFAQSMANGANPSAYMVGTPELFHDVDFDIVRDLFRFHRDHAEYYSDVESAARVALVSSRESQEYLAGTDGPEHITKEFRGFYRALLESHIPFDVIPAERLVELAEFGRLNRYDALILPNVLVMGDGQRRVVDDYVAAGGGLVASYQTATVGNAGTAPEPASAADGKRVDGKGAALRSLGRAGIVRRREAGADIRGGYLEPDDASTSGRPGPGLVLVDRGFLDVEPDAAAESAWRLLPPSRYGPPEKCHWETEPGAPGLIRSGYGRGRACYFPWPLGSLYHDLSVPEHRHLMVDAVAEVAGQGARIDTNAPAHVEVVVQQQAEHGRTLIHLINYSGHQNRAVHQPLPIRDVTMELSVSPTPTTAWALRLDRRLTLRASEERMTVELPRLDLYEVVALE